MATYAEKLKKLENTLAGMNRKEKLDQAEAYALAEKPRGIVGRVREAAKKAKK